MPLEPDGLVWLDPAYRIALTLFHLDEVALEVVLRRSLLRDDERCHVEERVVLEVYGSTTLVVIDQQVLVQVVSQDIPLDNVHRGIELEPPGAEPDPNSTGVTNARQLLVEVEVGRDHRLEEAVDDVDLLVLVLEGDIDASAQRWRGQDQVVAQSMLARVLNERLD